MKRLFIVPVVLMLALAGCATLSNTKVLASLSRVGVVLVSSNAMVGWYGQKQTNGGLLGAAMNLSSNSGKKPSAGTSELLSRADHLIGPASMALLAAIRSAEGPGFVPEEKVVGSAAYRAASGNSTEGVAFLKPQPYKFVGPKDTTLTAGLKSELGVDGDIFAHFQFTKMMKSGIGQNGTMGAQVSLTITVSNPKGTTLFAKRYFAASKESIPIAAGIYDPKKLEGAFSQAIDKACSEFAADLRKG